ncbi:MAG TPA: glycosyltransferase, partial [Nitrososphaera sp.]|nr:glycosyltransferase [Nitrososphaera sp.]
MTAVAIDSTDSQISIQQPLLSIILPVFNGRSKIRKTLQGLRIKLDQLEPMIEKLGKQDQELTSSQPYPPYEIIVVDDGSVDDTRKLVERLIQETPDIRLVSYQINKGKGYAIKRGVHA